MSAENKQINIERVAKYAPNFVGDKYYCQCGVYCDGHPDTINIGLLKDLQIVREAFDNRPVNITSLLRCPQHNANVGGVSNSKHLYGLATDFYIAGVNPNEIVAFCKTLPNYRYSYVIENKIGGAVHLDVNYVEEILPQPEETTTNTEGLYYQVHVKNIGDCPTVRDGMQAGTTGLGYSMQAIRLDLEQLKYSHVTANVKLHIADIGWVEYTDVQFDEWLGTKGEDKRIEAIEIDMQGLPENKTLQYQVHLAEHGWTGWVSNGFTAGTVGISTQIEAIRVVIV